MIPTTGLLVTADLDTVPNPVANQTAALLLTDGQIYVFRGSATWEKITGGGAGSGITQLTGDVLAGPGSGSQAAVLDNSGVVADIYGDATHVGAFAVDVKGRIISAANVPISGGGGGSVGDLLDYQAFRMTAAQGFTSNTAFANITGMAYPVGANQLWFSDFYLLVTGPRAGQLKFCFTWPTGATVEVAANGPASGFGTSGTNVVEGVFRTQQIIGVASGTIAGIVGCSDNTTNALMAHIRVTIQNGANAGTVQLQAAQNVSDGTITEINIGSSFEAKRFA